MAGGRGVFLAFEGGEGAGKSTQIKALAALLIGRGHDVVVTREPGATSVGQSIRRLVLDPASQGLSPRAEALLYAADRADHVDALISPALERGAVVITDRYVDSSLAYQGAGRRIDATQVEHVNNWATGGLMPDLTVLLDIDPVVGLARAGQTDRLEAEPLAFHVAVRAAFLSLAARDPRRYVVISADQEPQLVHDLVSAAVTAWLGAARQ